MSFWFKIALIMVVVLAILFKSGFIMLPFSAVVMLVLAVGVMSYLLFGRRG